jgi:hypothetical protein
MYYFFYDASMVEGVKMVHVALKYTTIFNITALI